MIKLSKNSAAYKAYHLGLNTKITDISPYDIQKYLEAWWWNKGFKEAHYKHSEAEK